MSLLLLTADGFGATLEVIKEDKTILTEDGKIKRN